MDWPNYYYSPLLFSPRVLLSLQDLITVCFRSSVFLLFSSCWFSPLFLPRTLFFVALFGIGPPTLRLKVRICLRFIAYLVFALGELELFCLCLWGSHWLLTVQAYNLIQCVKSSWRVHNIGHRRAQVFLGDAKQQLRVAAPKLSGLQVETLAPCHLANGFGS